MSTSSETRFCTACQRHKPTEGGVYKKCNGTARWICQPCSERKSVSPYLSNRATKPGDVERLKRALRGAA